MRKHEITLYKYNELSERAQLRAWENGPDFSGDFSGEFENTLKEFEKIFDISVYRYNVNDYNYNFAFVTAGRGSEAPEGDALRLARYIWNNYAEYISKGKYYSTPGRYINGKYNYKFRHSRVTFEMDNCPLTGVCMDQDILTPVINCLHYKTFFKSYDELIEACLNSFFECWRADIEYHASREYFAEICDANDYEFLETGELWK